MEQQRQEDQLADDLLADILRRVALRDLAVSRCVCKAWRVLMDDRHLLRADLRPCSLSGLFINYVAPELNFAELFSRPSTTTELPNSYPPHMVVADHCNGLLLVGHSVLNPATGRRVPLPERPRPPHRWMEKFPQDMFLVCDPTVSSHYEVFMIPRVPLKVEFGDEFDADGFPTFNFRGTRIDAAQLASEWLSSPCTLNVFSSVTGRWEKRSFHRDDGGEAAGTVADMQLDQRWYLHRRHAVYYQGALYVHCENDFTMRLSLANNRYQVIKPPTRLCEDPEFHLGKSEKGVYFALLDDEYRLRVWTLAESCGKMEWDLNHDSVRGLLLPSLNCFQHVSGPWILNDITCRKGKGNGLLIMEQKSEWYSDDENIIRHQDSEENCQDEHLEILAFHPYKEIVFLHRSLNRGVAYHLNSSKLEDLGNLSPPEDTYIGIGTSFPYTPL